jgi:hypothetical protein
VPGAERQPLLRLLGALLLIAVACAAGFAVAVAWLL